MASLAHGLLAAGLVVAVAAVAFASAAPQLATAEFAPAARNAVAPPPTKPDQTGATGGDRPGRRATTTTTLPVTGPTGTEPQATGSAPTTKVPRTRSCVGNPPRQTEDPTSAPCVAAIFEGENGGTTSRGVTATEIRVAIPFDSDRLPVRQAVDVLVNHVNDRFELYGRRIVPIYVRASATGAAPSRAAGADIAAQNVFAALTGIQEWAATPQVALPQELARQGIVTVVRGSATWWSDRTVFDPAHPYLWSVFPSAEDQQSALAEVACRLAGSPAAGAGDAALRAQTRKFGVVALGYHGPPPISVAVQALTECLGSAPETFSSATSGVSATDRRAGFLRLQQAGVNSIICVCENRSTHNNASNEARQLGFQPEWITTPTAEASDEFLVQAYRQSGAALSPILVQSGPKTLPMQARPWYPILQDASASIVATSNLQNAFSGAEYVYQQLMVLAAGLQGAGPALTPDSFAAGLMAMQFPNPGAGAGPYWQPSVGFGPGDHAFYDDYAIGWWNADPMLEPLEPYTPAGVGAWCYVGQGARFHSGTYPADLARRVFNPDQPCR